MTVFTPRGPRVLLLLIAVAVAPAGVAGLELLGASYRADVPFPQFLPFWRESWDLKDSVTGETVQYAYQGMPVGGSVHLFLRNGGEEPLESEDVLLDGISLSRAVAFSSQVRKREFHPVSIHFADLSSAERGRLLSAGEPIWWRVWPNPVAPGETAEALVGLRRTPRRRTVRLGLRWGNETRLVPVGVRHGDARMAGVSCSPELHRIYAYVQPGDGPRRARVCVLLDGRDVTQQASAGFDAACGVVPIVIRLRQALQPGSFHCLLIRFGTGTTAIAAIRAWSDDFCYGIWGYGKAREEEGLRRFLTDWSRHNINVHMGMPGATLREFLESPAGRQFCESLDLRLMTRAPGSASSHVHHNITAISGGPPR